MYPKNSPDVETRRFAWVMSPQGLQILSSKNSFTRLRIVTNDIVIVYVVFGVRIAGC